MTKHGDDFPVQLDYAGWAGGNSLFESSPNRGLWIDQSKYPEVLNATATEGVQFYEDRLFFVIQSGRTFPVMAQSSQDAWHKAVSALVEHGV